MDPMEKDELSKALEQVQEEEEPLCEILAPRRDEDVDLEEAKPMMICWQPPEQIVTRNNVHVGAGLRNLGNTCFLNSVLQCLTHTPRLVNCLKSTPHTTQCEHEGFCVFCALREHVNTALSSSGRVIEPLHLVDNLSNLSSSFQKFQQEDAHEYMHCLLEALHKSTLSPKAAQECLLLQGDSFVKNLFEGRLRSQIRCVECSHCSDNFESLIDLSLEIDKSSSITEALEFFTAVETIEYDDKYQCEKCKLGKSVFKQLTIDREPEVLVIQLKRFINTGIFPTKILKEVSYPQILDLKPFTNNLKDNEGDLKYELYGVLVHSGLSVDYGHYYSFVQTSPNVWHKLDDSQVKLVDTETVLKQQAYILFYFRQGATWFPDQVEEIKKHMSAESPKSVLDDSNDNDDSDSLTDKESHRSFSDGQKGLEESERIISDNQKGDDKEHDEVTAGCLLQVTKTPQQQVCDANELPTMEMPSNSILLSPLVEKEATKKPLVSLSVLSVEKRSTATSSNILGKKTTTPNSSNLSGEERVSGEAVLSFCKTERDQETPKPSRKMAAEASEEMPKYLKKIKIQGDEGTPKPSSRIKPEGDEAPKSSRKSSFDNVVNSGVKCSQGTPNSINKVLNHMPGSRRACLMQYVQPNSNCFQTPKKETTPSQSRKKRNSPSKGSVSGKRQKQNGMENKSPRARTDKAACSSKHPSQVSQGKHENLITIEDDPYSFGEELEQIPQYTCRTSEFKSNNKIDPLSLSLHLNKKKHYPIGKTLSGQIN